MRIFFFFLFVNFITETTFAQDHIEYRINPGQTISEVLQQKDIFKYPKFLIGNVFFKDGSTGSSLMNYNYLEGEMQFIDMKGDTLSIANDNPVSLITINKDSFYFDKMFLQTLATRNNLKLCQRVYIKFNDSRNTGVYDQQISATSAVSYGSMNGATQNLKLIVRELTIMERVTDFYIGDKFNHFTRLSNKSIFKIFGKKQKEIETFLAENKTNFKKQDDVIKLFDFLQTL